MSDITVFKRIHQCWEDWEMLKRIGKKMHTPCPTGKYQYIYKSKKGEISLVKTLNIGSGYDWEIFSLKGNLFEDVIKFKTKEEAEKYIDKLL